MRVASAACFGPVDPGCRHDMLVLARIRCASVCDGRNLRARPTRHHGLKGPAERTDSDSRFRDGVIAADLKDCPGLPGFAVAVVVVRTGNVRRYFSPKRLPTQSPPLAAVDYFGL